MCFGYLASQYCTSLCMAGSLIADSQHGNVRNRSHGPLRNLVLNGPWLRLQLVEYRARITASFCRLGLWLSLAILSRTIHRLTSLWLSIQQTRTLDCLTRFVVVCAERCLS